MILAEPNRVAKCDLPQVQGHYHLANRAFGRRKTCAC
jgi:hypothetical protein